MKSLFFKFNWVARIRNFGISYFSIIILVLLSLITTVMEIFGIGLFLPIFQFIRLEGNLEALVADSNLWQYAIDGFTYFNIKPSLLSLLVISFMFFLSRQIFIFIRIIYSATVLYKSVQLQRTRLFKKYMKADSLYHDSVPTGDLVSIVTTETHSATVGIMVPLELSVYFIMLIGYLTVLYTMSWEMTTFAIIIFIFVGLMPKKWIKQSKVAGRKLVDANISMSEFLVGRLRSPRLVRLSGTEVAEEEEFQCLTLSQRKHSVWTSILQAKTEVSMEPILVATSLSFLYFSYTVFQLQIEIIGLYLVITMRLLPVVKGILLKIQSIQGVLGSIEVLERRFKEMDEAREQDNGVKVIRKIRKSIFMNNVSYRYQSDKSDTLKGVTIEFKSCETTAIVGPSGAGKSTLIDLIPCLRRPTHGEVQLDSKNIEEYSLKSVRQLISYTPQSPQIFNGAIKDHILYGKIDATDKEIEEAIYLAGAESFVNKLPQGIDTIVGEDAIQLSGGQRQRLDLARTLVGSAKVLILDEPTSNLDAESEDMFKKVLTQLRRDEGTLIIIVAHRLASIMDADQIVVLNQGKIESIGTHSELLSQKGWYSQAWKVQNLLTY